MELVQTADRICNFNRHYAEFAGYWEQTSFLKEESRRRARFRFTTRTRATSCSPRRGRSFEQFVKEVARPRLAVVPR